MVYFTIEDNYRTIMIYVVFMQDAFENKSANLRSKFDVAQIKFIMHSQMRI